MRSGGAAYGDGHRAVPAHEWTEGNLKSATGPPTVPGVPATQVFSILLHRKTWRGRGVVGARRFMALVAAVPGRRLRTVFGNRLSRPNAVGGIANGSRAIAQGDLGKVRHYRTRGRGGIEH